ncbi:efflux RND transporter periplasmic adaptor subunit [Granulicella sp. dw_53]|uniref:efflux RND transporter periplasmic adaptor subunit n=1 Tax=Granulicella sp. dw_53 TaxID=2719792 RepID=UPI001BD657A5|nr:efflux RND transporter periplasmic adaptor subunit [Granulicella sp. dw_53]
MTHNSSNHLPSLNSPPSEAQTPKPTSKGRALIFGITATAVIGVAIFGGIHSRVHAEAQLNQVAKASATPFVNVIYPKTGSNAEEIQLPGNTQAFNDTPIYARTSGYVKQWYVDIGAHVKQGQLLAVIETPELDHQLAQARADLKNAQANLQISEITAKRWQNLLKTNSVSQQETDQAVSDLSSKEAVVDSNKSNVDRLEQLQAFERITAPFSGIITARNTDIGALIQAGDNSTPKELFHLAAIQTLRVYIPVPEVYAGSIRTGEKVDLTLDAFPNDVFTGTLVRNADAIDATSRTLNVEVDVDNPKGKLFPGAYAFVHLKVPSSAGAVTIPSNALLFRSEGLRAGVVRNGHIELIPITIGQDYGSSVEVLSGLSPKDAVIVNPSDSLANNSPVQIENDSKTGARQ